jgi:hypothetical protein
MSDTKDKAKRQQLYKLVGLQISHARVRKHLSDYGINREPKSEIRNLKEQIEAIKKLGAPELGPKPEKTGKPKKSEYKDDNEAYEAALSEHEAEMVDYEAAKSEYNVEEEAYKKYVSEEYKRLVVVHSVTNHLLKISAALNRREKDDAENDKGFSDSGKKELKKMQDAFGKAPGKYGNEKAAAFKSRSDIHKEIMTFLGDVDTDNVESVDNAVESLKNEYPDLKIFLDKDDWSKQNIRLNDLATIAVATVIQTGLEELIEHAMRQAIKNNRKIIHADHIVTDGIGDCSLAMLFENLPHWISIEDRQHRRAEYEDEMIRLEQNAITKARNLAKRKGVKYVRPEKQDVTFGEYEHENGHCEKIVVSTTNKEGNTVKKPRYKWYGIDIEKTDNDYDDDEDDEEVVYGEREGSFGFAFYVKELCRAVRNAKVEENHQDHFKIRIGSDINKFCSDLSIDFINRLCPLIQTAIDYKKAATINDETIKFVLRMILLDSRPDVDGTDVLSEEHASVMDLIDSKVRQIKNHQTDMKSAHNADNTDDLDAEELEEDDNEEDITVPAKPAAATKRAGRRPRVPRK